MLTEEGAFAVAAILRRAFVALGPGVTAGSARPRMQREWCRHRVGIYSQAMQ